VSGTCSTYGEGRSVNRTLVGRPKGKRPLGRPRYRWRITLRWTDGANWIQLAQDSPMASFCEHGNEPSGSIKKAGCCLTS
jgi:hypothetical protein